ncbi:tetratricopeptide repeat protein 4-like, partial [Stylophora pistillata]|uniref:tetratricopeptide repeat protein 4-like n=1 Tax=Stylophora pistillata TaxID=50429 RepID=UPI000C0524F9
MAEGFTPVTGVKLDCHESTSNDMAEDSEDKERLDDATLRAKAKVFLEKGNEAYKQEKDYTCAVHFYTQGIHVECKDTRLIAILYSNRAAAHFHLGNYRETLADAKLALLLEPTLIKAIER